MKRHRALTTILALVFVGVLSGCGQLDINLNPHKTPYDRAISWYVGAWESYHKTWLALDEETKTQWVDQYHSKFLKVGKFLQAWAASLDDPTNPTVWEVLKTELEALLIKLAIE